MNLEDYLNHNVKYDPGKEKPRAPVGYVRFAQVHANKNARN